MGFTVQADPESPDQFGELTIHAPTVEPALHSIIPQFSANDSGSSDC